MERGWGNGESNIQHLSRASVAKVLTYAFWGNNSGSKQLARKPYNWCRPGWTWRACWRERCRSRRCGKLFWTGGGADTTSGVGPSPWTHRGGKLKHFSTHKFVKGLHLLLMVKIKKSPEKGETQPATVRQRARLGIGFLKSLSNI